MSEVIRHCLLADKIVPSHERKTMQKLTRTLDTIMRSSGIIRWLTELSEYRREDLAEYDKNFRSSGRLAGWQN